MPLGALRPLPRPRSGRTGWSKAAWDRCQARALPRPARAAPAGPRRPETAAKHVRYRVPVGPCPLVLCAWDRCRAGDRHAPVRAAPYGLRTL